MRMLFIFLLGAALAAQSPKPIPADPKTLEEYRAALAFSKLKEIETRNMALQQQIQAAIRDIDAERESVRKEVCTALKLSDKCTVNLRAGTASEPAKEQAKEPEKK